MSASSRSLKERSLIQCIHRPTPSRQAQRAAATPSRRPPLTSSILLISSPLPTCRRCWPLSRHIWPDNSDTHVDTRSMCRHPNRRQGVDRPRSGGSPCGSFDTRPAPSTWHRQKALVHRRQRDTRSRSSSDGLRSRGIHRLVLRLRLCRWPMDMHTQATMLR